MPWLLYICIFFTDILCFDTFMTGTLRGVSNKHCLLSFFHCCCNQPKVQAKRSNHRVICPKDVNAMVNSENPDQTASNSLIWVIT